jgi:2-C-methyl-D-erythritol 2,4-cyclodiphosphate synthase
MEMIREAGWELANADVTVILDQPKLNPIIPAIKENLAIVMGVEVDQISLKATTSEGLGFVGRAEGISATAVALITKA